MSQINIKHFHGQHLPHAGSVLDDPQQNNDSKASPYPPLDSPYALCWVSKLPSPIEWKK